MEAKKITRVYKGITVHSYKGNHGSSSHIVLLPNGSCPSSGDYAYAKKRINKYLKEGK